MSKFSMYKVKDHAESYYIKKPVIFDLPLRVAIVGASQRSGKSNCIVNLICRDEFYNQDIKGENIFIVSPSISNDEKLQKLIEVKDVPETNLFTEYDEECLEALYKMLTDDYEEAVANKMKPEQKLIIFDDISYKGDLKRKQHGIVSKLVCNGRHILVSTIVCSQKYTDLPTVLRENLNGCILFSCSNKQLDLIEQDHNYLNNKKHFYDMFRKATDEKHSFFVINYTNEKEDRYQNANFDVVK